MKYILFFFFVLTTNIHAQEIDDTIYESAQLDEKPEYDGGINKLYEYIAKRFQVPDVRGLKGKIIVKFIIEKDGSISNIEVVQHPGHGTDKQIIKLMEKTQKWKPAKKNGQIVRSYYQFPINIQSAE